MVILLEQTAVTHPKSCECYAVVKQISFNVISIVNPIGSDIISFKLNKGVIQDIVLIYLHHENFRRY